MFQRAQQQKIAEDQIRQLRSDNNYRKEVLRLEQRIQDLEKEKADLSLNLDRQRDEINVIRENQSDLMTENTVLKNAAKVKKQEFSESDTQTECSVHCSDISVQTDFVDDVQVEVNCEKCEVDKKLIGELVLSLEMIEKSVHYTKSLECEKSITELVGRLDIIEKHIFPTNDQPRSMNCSTSNPNNIVPSSSSNTVHPSGKAYIPSIKDTTLSQMNTFRPLQHVNNTHYIPFKPPIEEKEIQPSKLKPLPLIPGDKLYSEALKGAETTLIVTDSMTGGVKAKAIKRNIGSKNDQVLFRRFPGHTAEDIAFYVSKPLSAEKPDNVIIVAGTNDLARASYEKEEIDEFEVVESILKIGRAAREHGAKKICISSIMVRRGHRYREVVKKVNDLLYMTCVAEEFNFIDQDDITLAHISQDGVHLNANGTIILLYNILSVFSTFDRNLIDFMKDYQYAKSLS